MRTMEFADLNASGRTFVAEVRAFVAWLREHADGVEWDDVVVQLNPFAEVFAFGDDRLPAGRRWTPEELEPHAWKVLSTAQRGWANLTGKTVEDGTLVVEVEWIPEEPGRTRPVSVNYSGISRGDLDRLRR